MADRTHRGNLVHRVDDQDSDLLSGIVIKFKLRVSRGRPLAYSIHHGRVVHRIVMERILGRPLETTEIVDHINSDALDNQRSNLRLVNPTQNACNRRRNRNNKSGYKGVHYSPGLGTKHYQAQIGYHRHLRTIGTYATAELAAQAYDDEARKVFGVFARLNFPKGDEQQA